VVGISIRTSSTRSNRWDWECVNGLIHASRFYTIISTLTTSLSVLLHPNGPNINRKGRLQHLPLSIPLPCQISPVDLFLNFTYRTLLSCLLFLFLLPLPSSRFPHPTHRAQGFICDWPKHSQFNHLPFYLPPYPPHVRVSQPPIIVTHRYLDIFLPRFSSRFPSTTILIPMEHTYGCLLHLPRPPFSPMYF